MSALATALAATRDEQSDWDGDLWDDDGLAWPDPRRRLVRAALNPYAAAFNFAADTIGEVSVWIECAESTTSKYDLSSFAMSAMKAADGYGVCAFLWATWNDAYVYPSDEVTP